MEAEYTEAYGRLYREHWWWRAREEILLETIRGILKGRDSGLGILDVGCGAGLFFDALEEFGHVEGIESSSRAVEQSGRWRNRIHLGELDGTYTASRTFAIVLLLDVLEHVPDPEDLVRRSAALLSPGGVILATVPAFDWLWTSHDELNHHVRRYTAAEMRELMNRAGLKVLETRYLFPSLVLPKLVVRAKEAFLRSSPRVPRIPPRALNAALAYWFRAEHPCTGRLPFGSSVLAVAQRAVSA